MPTVQKSVLLMYSAEQMFELVHQVREYPSFLPWCGGTEILTEDADAVTARVLIAYRGIKQSFTTRNQYVRPQRIDLQLIDGPFTRLVGHWRFIPLREDACKVEFELDYAFDSGLLGKMLTPVFNHIAKTMVEAFVKRAESVYV